MFARTVRPFLRKTLAVSENNATRVRSYHEPAHLKKTDVGDLPIPQGSWQTANNAKQSQYNLRLIVGILFTGATITMATVSGLFDMNSSPPPLKKE